jgi:hypothetical protein
LIEAKLDVALREVVAAMTATLILRGTAPGAGRVATKALSIILLIIIPFGTALGIFGFFLDFYSGRFGFTAKARRPRRIQLY